MLVVRVLSRTPMAAFTGRGIFVAGHHREGATSQEEVHLMSRGARQSVLFADRRRVAAAGAWTQIGDRISIVRRAYAAPRVLSASTPSPAVVQPPENRVPAASLRRLARTLGSDAAELICAEI